MGTITLNIDDDTEKEFRDAVKGKYGIGKGKLGKAAAEAMKKWSGKIEQKKLREEALDIIKNGIIGLHAKELKIRREDIYAEREDKQLPR